jgi:tRNA1Val (adenine37-N6)-methyltransferase
MGKKVNHKKKILDIGSGTGLIMLMLAQNTEAEINGIEIDPIAFQQLEENIQQNSWSPRLNVFQGDVRHFDFSERYDFIITNPPFFENDLLSTSKEEQTAKHSTALNFEELLQAIDKQLTAEGSFGILLPYHRESEFNQNQTPPDFI